jgi:hypothetical protein
MEANRQLDRDNWRRLSRSMGLTVLVLIGAGALFHAVTHDRFLALGGMAFIGAIVFGQGCAVALRIGGAEGARAFGRFVAGYAIMALVVSGLGYAALRLLP